MNQNSNPVNNKPNIPSSHKRVFENVDGVRVIHNFEDQVRLREEQNNNGNSNASIHPTNPTYTNYAGTTSSASSSSPSNNSPFRRRSQNSLQINTSLNNGESLSGNGNGRNANSIFGNGTIFGTNNNPDPYEATKNSSKTIVVPQEQRDTVSPLFKKLRLDEVGNYGELQEISLDNQGLFNYQGDIINPEALQGFGKGLFGNLKTSHSNVSMGGFSVGSKNSGDNSKNTNHSHNNKNPPLSPFGGIFGSSPSVNSSTSSLAAVGNTSNVPGITGSNSNNAINPHNEPLRTVTPNNNQNNHIDNSMNSANNNQIHIQSTSNLLTTSNNSGANSSNVNSHGANSTITFVNNTGSESENDDGARTTAGAISQVSDASIFGGGKNSSDQKNERILPSFSAESGIFLDSFNPNSFKKGAVDSADPRFSTAAVFGDNEDSQFDCKKTGNKNKDNLSVNNMRSTNFCTAGRPTNPKEVRGSVKEVRESLKNERIFKDGKLTSNNTKDSHNTPSPGDAGNSGSVFYTHKNNNGSRQNDNLSNIFGNTDRGKNKFDVSDDAGYFRPGKRASNTSVFSNGDNINGQINTSSLFNSGAQSSGTNDSKNSNFMGDDDFDKSSPSSSNNKKSSPFAMTSNFTNNFGRGNSNNSNSATSALNNNFSTLHNPRASPGLGMVVPSPGLNSYSGANNDAGDISGNNRDNSKSSSGQVFTLMDTSVNMMDDKDDDDDHMMTDFSSSMNMNASMGTVVPVVRNSYADEEKRRQLMETYQRELSKYRQQLSSTTQGMHIRECG